MGKGKSGLALAEGTGQKVKADRAIGRKAAKHSQRGKDNGERAQAAKPVAEAIIASVQAKVTEDHAMGAKVKELRDGGVAWWRIAYELNLPGCGPNAAQGKSGAARARALYRKTYGELPGDVVQRSTKASRAAGTEPASTVHKPVFTEDQVFWKAAVANEDILDRVTGHEIRWVGHTQCSDGTTLSVERETRVHPEGVRIERRKGLKTTLHFREYEKGDAKRPQQWRSVYVADIYDIRR